MTAPVVLDSAAIEAIFAASPAFRRLEIYMAGVSSAHSCKTSSMHSDAILPMVAVTESALQRTAMLMQAAAAVTQQLREQGERYGLAPSLNVRLQPFIDSFAAERKSAVATMQKNIDSSLDVHMPPDFGQKPLIDEPRNFRLGRAVANATQSSAIETGIINSEPNLDVAVVTMCSYNSSETVLANVSLSNLRDYCVHHNIPCYLSQEQYDAERPPAWSKVVLLAKTLSTHRWVMWKDCDSFFMKPELSPSDLLRAAGAARGIIAGYSSQVLKGSTELAETKLRAKREQQGLPQDPSLFTTLDPETGFDSMTKRLLQALGDEMPPGTGPSQPKQGETPEEKQFREQAESEDPTTGPSFAYAGTSSMDLVISEDGFMLNSGVFFLRNSEWSMSLLKRAYGDLELTAAPPTPLDVDRDNNGKRALPRFLRRISVNAVEDFLQRAKTGHSPRVAPGEEHVPEPANKLSLLCALASMFTMDSDRTRVDQLTFVAHDACSWDPVARTWLTNTSAYYPVPKILHGTPPPRDGGSLSSASKPLVKEAYPAVPRLTVPRVYTPPADKSGAEMSSVMVVAEMLRSVLPFNRNRAWEQATIFSSLATSGVGQRGMTFTPAPTLEEVANKSSLLLSLSSPNSLAAPAVDTAKRLFSESSSASRSSSRGSVVSAPGSVIDLSAYDDVARSQFVPQAWLNSYPEQIANKLFDHKGRGMHASYEDGDWIISFSGCGVLLSKPQCEELYYNYGVLAQTRMIKANEERRLELAKKRQQQ